MIRITVFNLDWTILWTESFLVNVYLFGIEKIVFPCRASGLPLRLPLVILCTQVVVAQNNLQVATGRSKLQEGRLINLKTLFRMEVLARGSRAVNNNLGRKSDSTRQPQL